MNQVRDLVARALAEDLGSGDVTSEAVVDEGTEGTARIVQKARGVLYGLEVAEEVFRQAGTAELDPLIAEGQWREEVPVEVARITGSARAMLAGERTALNFLGHLSGVATLTARFVSEIEGSEARILDTRKTLPALRALEKAAVVAGGGENHRMGLHDAVLIKENHIALAGGVGEAVRQALGAHPQLEVEVECQTLDELKKAIGAGASRVLLDNMGTKELREAVAVRDQAARGAGTAATLEASGRITLENVREVAATGVDFISIGAITHSAPALDLSMELEPLR